MLWRHWICFYSIDTPHQAGCSCWLAGLVCVPRIGFVLDPSCECRMLKVTGIGPGHRWPLSHYNSTLHTGTLHHTTLLVLDPGPWVQGTTDSRRWWQAVARFYSTLARPDCCVLHSMCGRRWSWWWRQQKGLRVVRAGHSQQLPACLQVKRYATLRYATRTLAGHEPNLTKLSLGERQAGGHCCRMRE